MELDRRAAEAADRLRREVDLDLDVDAALDRVTAGSGRRHLRANVGWAAAAVAALVVAFGLVMAASAGLGGGPGPDTGGEDIATGPDGTLSARGAQILGGLPDGPLDGRESWRLPVVADPQSGLHEGDQVMLYGRGFVPGELVGAVHCASEADTASHGVDACDLGEGFSHTTSTSARSDGSVVVQVTVRRYIDTPGLGRVDCMAAAERCLLAIGAADDYDRSGGSYVNFADAPPFPEPTFTVDPAGPYTPGQQVVATAAGLLPGRPGQVLQCVGDDHCVALSQGRVGEDGRFAATVTVGSSVSVDGQVLACDGDCWLAFTGIGPAEATSAPFPPRIHLDLLPGDLTVEGATPTTAPGSGAGPAVPGPVTTVPADPGSTVTTAPGATDATDPSVPVSTAPPVSPTAPAGTGPAPVTSTPPASTAPPSTLSAPTTR